MRCKRQYHLPELKAKVALAAIKGDKTLVELSEHFDVHQNKIQDWKMQLLNQTDPVFDNSKERKTVHEAQLKDLHSKIGELTLENEF